MTENKDQMVTAADVAEVVKKAFAEHAKPILDEALKPYIEKSNGMSEYAQALVEIERKKSELQTPPGEKGLKLARYARALALGKGDPERAIRESAYYWGTDDHVTKGLKSAYEKALTAGSPTGAGALIPPAVSAEFIELLRGRAVVRSLARIIPMPNGHLQIRKQTAAATASYSGESTNITASQQTVGMLNLSFKKLAALTPVSNSLLRFANPEVDRMVRDDLLAVMSLKEDAAFLAGNGLVNMPAGVFTQVDPANVFADAGTTYAQQIGDYTKAIKLIEEADVPIMDGDLAWVLAPRVFWGVYKTTGATEDATSPFQAGLNLNPPRLVGNEVHRTTQAKKAFAGSDATESTLANTADRIYLVHKPSLLIGDSLNLQVDAYDGGAYVDATTGAVVSAVSRDETVIRVISEHDFALRYALAASVITGVSVGS